MEKGGWFTNDSKGAYGVGLWKEINKKLDVLKQYSNFVVGDGRCVCFWEDIWCGMEPLSITFHNIYNMAAAKGGFLADFWNWSGEGGGWNRIFLHSFNDWELDMLSTFWPQFKQRS